MAFKPMKNPSLLVDLEDGKRLPYDEVPVGTRYKQVPSEGGTTCKDTFVVTEKRSYVADWAAGKRAEFYDHVRPELRALAERPERITHDEYMALRANSYERHLLHKNLDDEALCKLTEYCMGQSGRSLGEFDLPRHYNDAVERELAPLLVKRLREVSAELAEIKSSWGERIDD